MCRGGERGREERVWMVGCGVVGGEGLVGERREWRQVFVRWILGSRDEEGGR